MKISELRDYIVRRYFNETARRTALLFIGPPAIGKSTAVYEAAEKIAKRLGKKFLKFRLRWKEGKFTIDTDGQKDVMELLNDPKDYFVLVDMRLSTVAPEDLSGIPRSHGHISFYEPLAWAALLSTTSGIAFFDERWRGSL